MFIRFFYIDFIENKGMILTVFKLTRNFDSKTNRKIQIINNKKKLVKLSTVKKFKTKMKEKLVKLFKVKKFITKTEDLTGK